MNYEGLYKDVLICEECEEKGWAFNKDTGKCSPCKDLIPGCSECWSNWNYTQNKREYKGLYCSGCLATGFAKANEICVAGIDCRTPNCKECSLDYTRVPFCSKCEAGYYLD